MKNLPTMSQLLDAMTANTHRLGDWYPFHNAAFSVNPDKSVEFIQSCFTGEDGSEDRALITKIDRYDDINQCYWVFVDYSDFPVALEFLKPFNPFA